MDARNAGRHGIDAEEVILDARCYAEYVKSMDRWGHGPVQGAT